MKNLRNPPAYQEYAASMLSNPAFRLLTLDERGLLYTLRLECWANFKVCSSVEDLATILNLDVHRVRRALSSVMHFFEEVDGSLHCPELDMYRLDLERRRQRQSMGGKKGAATSNSQKIKTASQDRIQTVRELPAGKLRVISTE